MQVALMMALGCASLAAWSCIPRPLVETAPEVEYTSSITSSSTACGLTTDGQVFCWSRSDPRPGLLSGTLQFVQISMAATHGCGIVTDGTAYCWGRDAYGQLGLGEGDPPPSCQLVGGSPVCGLNPVSSPQNLAFVAVHTGQSHSCGLVTDGTAYCWGSNLSGQLGAVTSTACLGDLGSGLPCSRTPVPVAGIRFQTLSSGSEHTCGLDLSGLAYCWGAGGSGRLGTGSTDGTTTPKRASTNRLFESITAGGAHTCAVTTEGSAYCWGSNSDLQLATSETDPACGRQIYRCFTVPVAVAPEHRFKSLTASSGAPYSAIGGHTCGLTEDGRALCWGLNESGQLVRYNDLRSKHPIEISTDLRFLQISAGLDNTCGVTTDQQIACWAEGGPVDSWYYFK